MDRRHDLNRFDAYGMCEVRQRKEMGVDLGVNKNYKYGLQNQLK